METINICNRIQNKYLRFEFRYGGSPFSVIHAYERLKAHGTILSGCCGIVRFSDISDDDINLVNQLNVII